ncbi:MAG: OadG family transporter subunit [Gammaproteobacteria bacterium]|nr:OadG family transporter subunit [Gammaproteobacteria bacterium]
MNIDALLTQSLQLLGLGMGSVFIILCLLIGIVSIISKLVPEDQPVAPAPAVQPPVTDDSLHIAVIQAAIHKFRKSRDQ